MLLCIIIFDVLFFTIGFLCGRYNLIRIKPLDNLLDKISRQHKEMTGRNDKE